MAAGFDLTSLLGLHVDDARQRLQAAGVAEPHCVKSVPSRTRHELPAEVDWRVARVRWSGDTPELVTVPAVPLPSAASDAQP